MTGPTPTGHGIDRSPRIRQRWLPGQHGAWAMLAVPLLLGVAVSRPVGWHVVLGAAALAGYLASATVQAWARARRASAYRVPMLLYGSAVTVLGLALVVAFPALALAGVVVVSAGILVLRGARPGARRDLLNSFAQVAQALVLTPAAAVVSGVFEPHQAVVGTAIAAAYLVGTVLVVRSVLRERGSTPSAVISVVVHLALIPVAIALLPAAYAGLAVVLAARAAALPFLRRRLTGGPRPLRPIHVGLVELAAAVAVVGVAFAVPI